MIIEIYIFEGKMKKLYLLILSLDKAFLNIKFHNTSEQQERDEDYANFTNDVYNLTGAKCCKDNFCLFNATNLIFS